MLEATLFWTGIAGLILCALSAAGFVRNLMLLGEAKTDHEELGDIGGLAIMGRFFIRANYVHLSKLSVIFVTGLLMVLANLPGAPDSFVAFRFIELPLSLVLICLFALLLGEMEARARRRTKRYYRRKRREEEAAAEAGREGRDDAPAHTS